MEHRKPASKSETPSSHADSAGTLETLPWLPVLETGDEAIDRDHREATESGNKLRRMINDRASWPLFLEALRQKRDHSARHFETEELILETVRFPGADAHRRAHARILAEFNRILAELELVTVPEDRHWELAQAPLNLSLDHCVRDDLKFKSHLMQYGPRK